MQENRPTELQRAPAGAALLPGDWRPIPISDKWAGQRGHLFRWSAMWCCPSCGRAQTLLNVPIGENGETVVRVGCAFAPRKKPENVTGRELVLFIPCRFQNTLRLDGWSGAKDQPRPW